jgi:uncharacterized membrane protein YgcG
LIVLKLGFLLLLVAGPFFLIVGTHPGFGRVIAIRWFEMLVGVLMKSAAVAIVLSVLLYCYSLIMGTADAVLPWALKILMIALVTVAVFIYRKPFSHLFSAVGYGTLGSTERAEYSLREASHTFRRSTLDAATAAVPGMTSYRAARWARRNQGQAAAVAVGAAAGVAAGTAAGTAAGRGAAAEAAGSAADPAAAGTGDAYASRLRPDAPPPADGDGEASGGSRRVVGGASGPGSARARNVTEADGGSGRVAPPLDLPPRHGANGAGGPNGSGGSASAPATGWSRGAGRSPGTVPAGTGPRPRAASAPPAPSPARPSAPASGPASAPVSAGPPPVRSQSRGGGAAPPVSRPAPRPSSSGSGARGSNGGGSNGGGSNGGGSNGGAPAWPASGWPSAGPRQRSAGRARPNPAPQPPADSGGGSRSSGQDEPPATPFWLRPIRRDK